MKFTYKTALLLALSLMFMGFAHKFYVSISDISYNDASGTYQISTKVFTDDLENALEKWHHRNPHFGTEHEAANADSILFLYVKNNFAIGKEPSTTFSLNYIGRETELDVTWIYLETSKAEKSEKVWIKNSMLTGVFEDQVNMVNVEHEGKKIRSALLKRNHTSETLEIK